MEKSNLGGFILYSWEIEQLLQMRNYFITVQEYLKISDIKENPQISEIKYEPFSDDFNIWTKDQYHFKFKVKKYTE